MPGILKRAKRDYYTMSCLQLIVSLFLLWLSQLFFGFYNADIIGNPSAGRIFALSFIGWHYTLGAWAYFNALFIVMRALPCGFVARRGWVIASDIFYFLSNSAMLILNLADTPYVRFSGVRLSGSALRDLLSDGSNVGLALSFGSQYALIYTLIALAVIATALAAFGLSPKGNIYSAPGGNRSKTLRVRWAIFLGAALFTFFGLRGGNIGGAPLKVTHVFRYTTNPAELKMVLNTPFNVLRSGAELSRVDAYDFFPPEELDRLRSSVHRPDSAAVFSRKNLFIITIEGGAAAWLDRFKPYKDDLLRGHTPFLDSLASRSLVATECFGTGVQTIQGLSSIYGGFPSFGTLDYMESPYCNNTADTPALLLGAEGYSSRYYFGGDKDAFHIDEFLGLMGFSDVTNRPKLKPYFTPGSHWGLWDYEMAGYAVRDLSTLPEPFVAGWLTLHPHSPFELPDELPDGLHLDGPCSGQRCMEYVDRSLRRFFDEASRQPWFRNTLFIITGDHGWRDAKGTPYATPYVFHHIIFMAYAPDGSIPPATVDTPMSQFDIPATALGLLGYSRPYVSIGADLLGGSHAGYALTLANDEFMIIGDEYVVMAGHALDGVTAVYSKSADPQLTRPLDDYSSESVGDMLMWARALMQDYSSRINGNTLRINS